MQTKILETLAISECKLTPGYIWIGSLPDGREVGYFPADPRSEMVGDQFDERIVVEISIA